MDDLDFFNDYLQSSIEVKKNILGSSSLKHQILAVAGIVVQCFKNGGKVLIAGNGGSAADAQHIAAEFVSRFFYDRPGLPSIALTTDTSMLTAIGNDYGFDQVFARQVQALARPEDVFIGISTSGNSPNVLNACKEARHIGATVIGFCGAGGALANEVDFVIAVPSESTPFIQESHICVGHVICAIAERSMFPPPENKHV